MIRASSIPLINRALSNQERVAIIDRRGVHRYGAVINQSIKIAQCLLRNTADLEETRVAFMTPPGIDYVAAQWGIWQAGGIAVPLCLSHPLSEIEYVINNAGAKIIITHPEYEEYLSPLIETYNLILIHSNTEEDVPEVSLPVIEVNRKAMILFTSGTTSKPKGVVTTHRNIRAQITSLVESWEISADDRILHALPLHHIHGIINALYCPLWAGASCEMMTGFNADSIWERFVKSDLTLFMAVPTIYVKLIASWEKAGIEEKETMSTACSKMRLMISGSAALPVNVLEKWEAICGHTLLERYGMTEIGMALSNPLHGDRKPGFVGTPLPGIELQLVEESGKIITEEMKDGEIQVKGENVFQEYWGNAQSTRDAFQSGWFRTGDIAVIKNGYYRILGRNSTDIIKSGGYKISALEIEEVLRSHPEIEECAVVGINDEEWGERICAAIVTRGSCELTLDNLRLWARERIAKYKIPSRLKIVPRLPQNVMAKVTKPEVKKLF
jgi:malonyl-CoA/methylmalonyl-CoA synthetase